ncbi:MAG: beta-propeller fold lactonase family protein [Candidatus Acidiferrales bacterium]
MVAIQPNPTPMVTSISPNSALSGGPAFVLTINGTNFIAASTVSFGGVLATTTFVSSSQLTAAIPAVAIASAGNPVVTVTNPAPGGGTSIAVNFTITSPNPIPMTNNLIPDCAPVDEPAFSLLVIGSGFVPGAVVQWNGSALPTTFNGPTFVQAQVPASDLAVAGTPVVASVTVFNPPPGGGNSNTSNFTITAGGVGPESIALDPTGRFAYVANNGCPDAYLGYVSMYTIDATTGALATVGPPISSNDEGAQSLSVDPLGKFAYVANWGEGDTIGSVSAYSINATTGALTITGTAQAPCLPPPNPGSCAPVSMVVDPSAKFAYAANEGGFAPTSISMFTFDAASGSLTTIGTVAVEGRAIAVTVDPTGKFVYAANVSEPRGSPGNVCVYAINASTGGLTFLDTISAGTDPTSVAEDPTGKFAYVTNSGSNDVSIYTINAATGALTSIGQINAEISPSFVAVDPTGKFAYVTNSGSNDVSMYTIDAATGALTSMGSVMAGSAPSSIAIHPSGKFAYVTNFGSNTVSVFSINAATGALTLIGTIGT